MKEDENIISFWDLVLIFKRAKKTIILIVLFFTFLAIFYALTRPIIYVGKASFREKSQKEANTGESSSLKILGIGWDATGSEALAWMQSRRLMEQVIKKNNLQAILESDRVAFPILTRIFNNLKVEYGFWIKKKEPVVKDTKKNIFVTNIDYEGEVPLSLSIRVRDEKSCDIYEKKKFLGVCQFGQPFKTDKFSIILKSSGAHVFEKYRLTLLPMYLTCWELERKIKIKPDKKDKMLLRLEGTHSDRYLASANINCLMDFYLDHLRFDHKHFLKEHLSYLEKRQEEIGAKLQQLLEKHLSILSSDLSSSGFPSAQSAVEFLTETMQLYTKRLYSIELEIKRLLKFRFNGYVFDDWFRSEGNFLPINEVFSEITKLKQQSDSIELALKRDASFEEITERQEYFSQTIAEYHNIQVYKREVKELLKVCAPLDQKYRIFQDPKYLAGYWVNRLQNEKISEDERGHFRTYLLNLSHFFEVYEKTLKERLTHQYTPNNDLQGINLSTAQALHLEYCKELGEIEANCKQYEYLVEQVKDFDFEISSLCTVLSDPVSKRLIDHASQIEHALHDEGNRSQKEQERLKSELAMDRSFLKSHLDQTLNLVLVKETLMQEKMYRLQKTTLKLIQLRISILEKQVEDFVETRLANLEQEKGVIYELQDVLKKELNGIPIKWASEKMIDQQVQMNQQIIAEVGRLVENKNISSNLDVIRSAPIDYAAVQVHPKSPYIVLFALLGAIFGLFCASFYIVGKSIIDGIFVSEENLRILGHHFSGSIQNNLSNPLKDNELNVMRSMLAYLADAKKGQLLLILGEGPNYASQLASLLSMRGQSAVILPLSFDLQGMENGLLSYFEGESKRVDIYKTPEYDKVLSGGASRFSFEWAMSLRFDELMQELNSSYDWVIATTSAMPTSSEIEGLRSRFHHIGITLQNEKLHELTAWFSWQKLPDRRVSYLLYSQELKKKHHFKFRSFSSLFFRVFGYSLTKRQSWK